MDQVHSHPQLDRMRQFLPQFSASTRTCKGLQVDQVAKLDQDLAIYQDFGRGMRKVRLAEKYGMDRHTITAAIKRAKAEAPRDDRVEIFDQSTEILDNMLEVYVPLALDQDKAAGRLVDRLIGRRNEMLGLDSPAKLELHQAEHQPPERVDVKAELAMLVARMRNGGDHGQP
jgi:hypothetical protein